MYREKAQEILSLQLTLSWCAVNKIARSKTRSVSYTNLIFLVTYQSMCPIPIQNDLHCQRTEITESPKYEPYDNIKDFSKGTFWYHSNNTKKIPWVLLCSNCPINNPSSYLHITIYPAVMLKTSWHTAEGN